MVERLVILRETSHIDTSSCRPALSPRAEWSKIELRRSAKLSQPEASGAQSRRPGDQSGHFSKTGCNKQAAARLLGLKRTAFSPSCADVA
jgi:hypothetical protein